VSIRLNDDASLRATPIDRTGGGRRIFRRKALGRYVGKLRIALWTLMIGKHRLRRPDLDPVEIAGLLL